MNNLNLRLDAFKFLLCSDSDSELEKWIDELYKVNEDNPGEYASLYATVWEPFENYTVRDLITVAESLENDLIETFKKGEKSMLTKIMKKFR